MWIKDGCACGLAATTLYSMLEVVTVNSTDRTAIYVAPERFEAPNWIRMEDSSVQSKRAYREDPGDRRYSASSGHRVRTRCNNDHGISPDGAQL